jgi:hypothetical protein
MDRENQEPKQEEGGSWTEGWCISVVVIAFLMVAILGMFAEDYESGEENAVRILYSWKEDKNCTLMIDGGIYLTIYGRDDLCFVYGPGDCVALVYGGSEFFENRPGIQDIRPSRSCGTALGMAHTPIPPDEVPTQAVRE